MSVEQASIRVLVSYPDRVDEMEAAISLAMRQRLHEHAARGLFNLVEAALIAFDLDGARETNNRLRAYDEAIGDLALLPWVLAEDAYVHFRRGRWSDAAETIHRLLDIESAAQTQIRTALMLLGRIQVRRGDPEAAATLRTAWQQAVDPIEFPRAAAVVSGAEELASMHDNHKLPTSSGHASVRCTIPGCGGWPRSRRLGPDAQAWS